MLTLTIKELTDFRKALNRDVIVDGKSRPVTLSNREFLTQVINYGNDYLERAKRDYSNTDYVIWFDIHFGDPAVVGMTWAYNPRKPEDPEQPGCDFFWRMWSETDPVVGSLFGAQQAFADYCVQGAK